MSLLIFFILSLVVLLTSYYVREAKEEIEITVSGFRFVNFEQVAEDIRIEEAEIREDI